MVDLGCELSKPEYEAAPPMGPLVGMSMAPEGRKESEASFVMMERGNALHLSSKGDVCWFTLLVPVPSGAGGGRQDVCIQHEA